MAEINEFIDKKAEAQIDAYLKSLQGIATQYNNIFTAATQVEAGLTKINKTQSDAAAKQKAANDAAKEAAKIAKDQKSAADALDKQRTAALIQIAKQEQKEKDLAAAMVMEVKSIKDATTQNSALRQARNLVDQSTANGIAQVKIYNQKIDENTKFIRENTDAASKQSMNIGNYASALEGLPGPFGAAAAGAESFSKKMMLMLANPVIATIAAIAAVLYVLYNAMTRSEEGQNRLNKVMAEGKAVFDLVMHYLNEIAITLFDEIPKAFESATEDIGNFIKSVSNGFTQVRILWNQLTGDFAKAEELKGSFKALSNETDGLWSSVKKISTTWLDFMAKFTIGWSLIKKLTGLGTPGLSAADVAEAAKNGAALAEMQAKLAEDERKEVIENSELQKKSADLRAKAMEFKKIDADKSIAFMNQALILDEKVLSNELNHAKEKRDMLIFQAKTQKDNSREEKQAVADAIADVNTKETAFFEARRGRFRVLNQLKKESMKQAKESSDAELELLQLAEQAEVRANAHIISSDTFTLEQKQKAIKDNYAIELKHIKDSEANEIQSLEKRKSLEAINDEAYALLLNQIKVKSGDDQKKLQETLGYDLDAIKQKQFATDLKKEQDHIKDLVDEKVNGLKDSFSKGLLSESEYNKEVQTVQIEGTRQTTEAVIASIEEQLKEKGIGAQKEIDLKKSLEDAKKQLESSYLDESITQYKEHLAVVTATAAEEQSVIKRLYDSRVNSLKMALLRGEISEEEYNEKVAQAQYESNTASIKLVISAIQVKLDHEKMSAAERLDLTLQLEEAKQKLDNDTTDNAINNEKRGKDSLLNSLQTVSDIAGKITSIVTGYYQNETDALSIEKDRQLALVGDNKVEQDRINKEFARKEAEIAQKKAIAEKQAAIFSATIETATAIIKAAPNPFLMGLVAALGLAQIAVIMSQPIPDIPKFGKGVDSAPRGLAIVGEAGRELIMKNGKAQMINEPTMLNLTGGEKILNNKETELFLQSANKFHAGFDSAELKHSIESGNMRIVSAINNKKELHINSSGDRITERTGNFYKTYFNRKIKWVGKER